MDPVRRKEDGTYCQDLLELLAAPNQNVQYGDNTVSTTMTHSFKYFHTTLMTYLQPHCMKDGFGGHECLFMK